jgi:hypothetical protein
MMRVYKGTMQISENGNHYVVRVYPDEFDRVADGRQTFAMIDSAHYSEYPNPGDVVTLIEVTPEDGNPFGRETGAFYTFGVSCSVQVTGWYVAAVGVVVSHGTGIPAAAVHRMANA